MTAFFIFPHPDDETIFAGGTIARHAARGDNVIWICASYGERSGDSGRRSPRLFYFFYLISGYFPILIALQNLAIWWLSIFRKPNPELKKIRREEALQVSNIYSISEPVFWETPDMRFSKNQEALAKKIQALVEKHRPQRIYTLHPNGITGHPDHRTLGNVVIETAKRFSDSQKLDVFCATIPKPLVKRLNLPLIGSIDSEIKKVIELTGQELSAKKKAIATYRSQSYLWKIFLQKYPDLLEKEYFVKP